MTGNERDVVGGEGRAIRDMTIAEWIEGLAERRGDPGGGAAGGVMLAMGAALTAMVAAYTGADDAERRARELTDSALRRADADSVASARFGAALRSDDDARQGEAAVAGARSSAALARLALDAIAVLEDAGGGTGPTLHADVAAAGAAIRAAAACAHANLRSDMGAAGGGDDTAARSSNDDGIAAAAAACDEGVRRVDALSGEAAPG
ncbi:cyclodeaminase/cyclohydrolase family protein [Microbacterium sp. Marseille-Q6965]|uniref:cyclodeaminase/cyclohydrolase family protein n=1 Tax=Microbacterium sp. Marseille-Q6965 TaxID=2965072 RepID=UPI0021B7D3CF|nr:cyclodeaminase/cyclohydrolase family protein [Microbacterium sp. Marseille-Q6965]